jgi:transcriptional regulator with XRE-family HTH domain
MVFNKVLEYCRKNNLTIMAFEKMCGFGNGVVSGWKNGNPRIESLQKIEKATGIPISEWIMEGEP